MDSFGVPAPSRTDAEAFVAGAFGRVVAGRSIGSSDPTRLHAPSRRRDRACPSFDGAIRAILPRGTGRRMRRGPSLDAAIPSIGSRVNLQWIARASRGDRAMRRVFWRVTVAGWRVKIDRIAPSPLSYLAIPLV